MGRAEQEARVNLRCVIEVTGSMGTRGSILLGTSEEPCIICPTLSSPGDMKEHLFIGPLPSGQGMPFELLTPLLSQAYACVRVTESTPTDVSEGAGRGSLAQN